MGKTDGSSRGSGVEAAAEPPRPPRSGSYEDAFPVRLRRAADLLAEVARLLMGDAHGLGFTEMRVLGYLAERPRASVGEISRDLRVDQAWISRLLQALGARGVTVQTRDPSDSRVVLASLSPTGRALYDDTLSIVSRRDASIMAGIDEDLAGELMMKIETNLKGLAQELRAQERDGRNQKAR